MAACLFNYWTLVFFIRYTVPQHKLETLSANRILQGGAKGAGPGSDGLLKSPGDTPRTPVPADGE
jgi:hypothetical protein